MLNRKDEGLMIVWLGEPAGHEPGLVGGKAANLSRLAAAYRVPPGFCITTEAYCRWGAAGATRSVPELAELVTEAHRELARRCSAAEPSVAVRSSAADEDGALASFAGQLETVLNVAGAEAVADAVARCWASARSPRVLEYRRQHGLSIDDVSVAVLVQQLVPADVSGVVFSVNPVSGRRDEIVVNASWGLGESVVAGSVTPDCYLLRRADLAIVERRVDEKRRMTVSVPGGTREVEVPRIMRRQPALTDEQALAMARLALDLEHQMGWPTDVECAWSGGSLYLLQCRPVTTMPAALEGVLRQSP